MKRWIGQSLVLFLLTCTGMISTGCGDPSLSALLPAGPVAELQLRLMLLVVIVMVVVVVVVSFLFVYVLIRFRDRKGDTHIPKQVEGNWTLEIVWTIIPIILLIIIAIPTIQATFDLSSGYSESEGELVALEVDDEADINIRVTGHLFWWEVDYVDLDIITAQEIYIPVNKTVHFDLTSSDVIHSFWAPALAGKMDTNPGFTNKMWLSATKPGVYEGRCAELCGTAHALMNFRIIAVEEEEFQEWVTEMMAYEPPQPENERAQVGEALFAENCIACHAIDRDVSNPSGPSLAAFASRDMLAGYMDITPENLANWIANPDVLKPGALMPTAEQLGLSDADIEALVAYLQELQRPDVPLAGDTLEDMLPEGDTLEGETLEGGTLEDLLEEANPPEDIPLEDESLADDAA